jgi:hypothetical protein
LEGSAGTANVANEQNKQAKNGNVKRDKNFIIYRFDCIKERAKIIKKVAKVKKSGEIVEKRLIEGEG